MGYEILAYFVKGYWDICVFILGYGIFRNFGIWEFILGYELN